MSVTRVAIVGGADDMQRDLEGRLSDLGIAVAGKVNGEVNVGRLHIPTDAEAVLVLYEYLSHSLCDKARELAKERGIPSCLISRKWAVASLKLQQAGLLPEVPNPQSPEEVAPVVTKAAAPAPQQPPLPPEVEEALRLLAVALKESDTVIPRVSLERRADGQYGVTYEAQIVATGFTVL